MWFCHGSAIENIIYSQTQYFDCSLMVSLFNYRVSYVDWLELVCMYNVVGVSPNFEITVACGLKFHCYLRTLSLKFQKAWARTKIMFSCLCPVGCLSLAETANRKVFSDNIQVLITHFKVKRQIVEFFQQKSTPCCPLPSKLHHRDYAKNRLQSD